MAAESRLRAPQLVDLTNFTSTLIRRRSWLIAFILLDVVVIITILNSEVLREAWDYIWPGRNDTASITIVSFIFAVVIGLVVALARISKNWVLYNIATFYVELFRGLPLLVIILLFNFVLTQAFVDFVSGPEVRGQALIDNPDANTPNIPILDDALQRLFGVDPELIPTTKLRSRDISELFRIMLAFALTYGAFMSEVFRAGIESIGKGQSEAARSLGMTYVQMMRYIILPQAVKNVLPALANNFILLLKDTSLASAVAVREISYLARQYSSNFFRYPEGLLIISFLYANLTIILSFISQAIENLTQGDRKED